MSSKEIVHGQGKATGIVIAITHIPEPPSLLIEFSAEDMPPVMRGEPVFLSWRSAETKEDMPGMVFYSYSDEA